MIIYGYKTKDRGTIEVAKGKIPETSQGQRVIIKFFQKYVTLFFVIPIFPLMIQNRVAILDKRNGDDWKELKKKAQSDELKTLIKTTKKKFKVLLWMWIGTAFGILTLISFGFFALLAGPKSERLMEDLIHLKVGDYIVINTVDAKIYESTDSITDVPYVIYKIEKIDGDATEGLCEYSYEYGSDAADDAETVSYSDEVINIDKSYLELWIEEGYVYDIIQ